MSGSILCSILTLLQDANSDESEEESDENSESEEDSNESESNATPAPKKRKAETEIETETKKPRKDNAEALSKLFAGSLSWNIDDEALSEAFKDFEGFVSARVVMDQNNARSRGFGYVNFSDSDSASKALEAMQGKELDGRVINLDHALPANAKPLERAADRAKKHGDSVSPESDTLFVGNLSFEIDQDTVHEFFNAVREVVSVRLPTNPDTGCLKGFGYVSFGSVEDAKAAFEELNGSSIGTGSSARPVRLDFAGARPPREGSFGGNRGGSRGGFGGNRGNSRGGFGGNRGGPRGGRGAPRGRGRGGRGGASSYSGTKISFD